MVIVNSDSTGTLVTLEESDDLRKESVEEYHRFHASQGLDGRSTRLRLPECRTTYRSLSSLVLADYERAAGCLVLPGDMPVDEALGYYPGVENRCRELFSASPVHYSQQSPDRIIYVAQGEVAHATSSQCDVLVSDHATTCHILAVQSRFRSRRAGRSEDAFSSLAHIDGIDYEDCIRDLCKRHQRYQEVAVEVEQGCSAVGAAPIVEIEIHIMGGFDDANETSRRISTWLLRLLADIAHAEPAVRMTLRTCAISALNDDGYCTPIGRGLALHLRTGESFLAECDKSITGPSMALRSCRAFADMPKSLHCIHDETSSKLYINPFKYETVAGIDMMLALPDEVLLRRTSTSPHCEEDDFCASVRETLIFLRDVHYGRVFGDSCSRQLKFERVGCTNSWRMLTRVV